MSDVALTNLPLPVTSSAPVRRPRGTFVGPVAAPSSAFDWALRCTGAAAGWVTSTDAAAVDVARGTAPAGRVTKAFRAFAATVAIVVVPAWSVVANEFPESAAGTFAHDQVWIPFVVMAAMVAAWAATLGWRRDVVPLVPGAGALDVDRTAYLLTDAGLSVLVRDGGRVTRRDVLGSSVTRVSTRDEDADHVTVRLATPDGEVVMPWLPRTPEVTDTVTGWA